MDEQHFNRQLHATGNNSNIIFGTSSEDIQQGLDNGQFIDEPTEQSSDDKDQIVNEQEQNEVVNPSEETFNEETTPRAAATETTTAGKEPLQNQLEENVIDLDPDKRTIDKSGKISKAED